MKILLIDNRGRPTAAESEVSDGTTVRELLRGDPARYLVRVNGYLAGPEQTLCPGDKVSVRFKPGKGTTRPFTHMVKISARHAAQSAEADLERRWYLAAAAIDIRDHLLKASLPPSVDLPVQTWLELVEDGHHLREARKRGWYRAADSILFDLLNKLTTARQRLAAIERQLACFHDQPSIPPARTIANSLAAVCAG